MSATDACEECGCSIDQHNGRTGTHAPDENGPKTVLCFCSSKPSDILAARVAAVLAELIPRSMRDNYAGSLYTLGRYDLSEAIRAALAVPSEDQPNEEGERT